MQLQRGQVHAPATTWDMRNCKLEARKNRKSEKKLPKRSLRRHHVRDPAKKKKTTGETRERDRQAHRETQANHCV